MKKIKHIVRDTLFFITSHISLRLYAGLYYRYSKGYWMDWKHPRNINEKIQWLKFYDDTSQWPRLADKYAVREYVKEKGWESILIPLLGKWDKAEDIEWEKLPSQFAMKSNHGSGDVLICEDKSTLDTRYYTQYFARILKTKIGYILGEPHYNKIQPCIVAEELLDARKQDYPSSTPIDYKIWCFDGVPTYIVTYYNRTKESCNINIYDTEWNNYPQFVQPNEHYQVGTDVLPRPRCMEQMLRVAQSLTKGFPCVRLDLYVIDGKVFFGEMTFTPAGGLNYSYTEDFLNILGDLCKIK